MDLPVHIAAEKFMKSGESFLSHLLPYWSVRLLWQAQLLVLPLLVLLLPSDSLPCFTVSRRIM